MVTEPPTKTVKPELIDDNNIYSPALIETRQKPTEPYINTDNAVVPVRIIKDGKEETGMQEEPAINMSRKQLYDEIWEMTVAGVARKYDIPYLQLLKQIKEADIPIPPSGYLSQLSSGKPVTKTELQGPVDAAVSIFRTVPNARAKKTKDKPQSMKSPDVATEPQKEKQIFVPSEGSDDIATTKSQAAVTDSTPVSENNISPSGYTFSEPETYEQYGHTYNIYNRETLYKEVWGYPVTEVAKHYRVSDVAIHKVCKSLDIPTPPAGYWAKVRAGKPVTKSPLPKGNKPTQKTGIRTGTEYRPEIENETLSFLSEEDRSLVLSVATQIQLPDDNVKLHTKIIAHRRAVLEWKKKLREQEAKGWGKRGMESPLFLADTVSEETLPRVCYIIDALIRAMEPLGCTLTDNLDFVVNGETVRIAVSESKDEVKHVLTKEENMQFLKYEDEKRRHSWASKPNIRKYDHPYNGRISLTVNYSKAFRDCKSYVIEDKLGDIMIELYEASDVVRKEREAREEAERKRQEEEQRKEERKNRYNIEVDQTLALINLADDYDIACRIRRYISAVEGSGNPDEETAVWIEWAKAKADWYDPTIAKEDGFFGVREHEEEPNRKKLEHAGYRWW